MGNGDLAVIIRASSAVASTKSMNPRKTLAGRAQNPMQIRKSRSAIGCQYMGGFRYQGVVVACGAESTISFNNIRTTQKLSVVQNLTGMDSDVDGSPGTIPSFS